MNLAANTQKQSRPHITVPTFVKQQKPAQDSHFWGDGRSASLTLTKVSDRLTSVWFSKNSHTEVVIRANWANEAKQS